MAYNILYCANITELATRRGNANPLIGAILGPNYPMDEAFAVYEWKNTDTSTPDGYEIIASTSGDPTTGRWHRVENSQLPQVNSDWNAASGPAAVLNKPIIPAAQVASDWSATTGVTRILNKPVIPAAQVNSDWSASSGITQILNKPLFAAVSTSGAYSDLSGRPTLAAVATSGAYGDLSNRPTIPPAQVNSDWNATSGLSQILNKPSLASVATSGAYLDLSGKPSLSTVATSGSYNDLADKPSIPTAMSFAAPIARTVALATAYQATTVAKPAVITVTLTSTSSFSLSGTVNNIANIVIGPTAAVATGTGTQIANYENTLGGALTVGLNLSNKATNTYTITLPAGWYFAVRQTTGTGISVVSTFDQVVG